MTRAIFVLALTMATGVLFQPVAAQAQWSTQTEPGQDLSKAKPKPAAKTDPKSKTKQMARPTQTGPKALTPNPTADPVSRFSTSLPETAGPKLKSVAPASGEDAAYFAFDQGQYLTALDLAERAAAKGDPQAHTLVGRIYAEGLGVGKDEVVAARWYARAAELGDTEAAFALGLQLAEGRGIEKVGAAAANMFEKAAATGHPYANYNLGLLFLNGDGKPENPHRAAMHITYAAEKGVTAAQYDLAVLYQTGHGVQPNALEAARWMRRAAEQGMVEGEYDYALLLLRGFGLNAEVPKAIDYLRSAADKGFAGAQNRLAHLLIDDAGGRNVQPVESAKWRLLARDSGLKDEALDARIGKMSRADRQAAEKAAQEWRDRSSIGMLAQ